MRASDFIKSKPNRTLTIFDIDDTLFHTTAKIKVVKDGKVVRTLTNQEFNNYKLQPDEEFDFGEFQNAEKFNKESEPIGPMLDELKTILDHTRGRVIMLTARSDFDDKDTFLKTFKDHGIDMNRIHVHRAGNLPGDAIPAEKKAVWVRKYLNTGDYDQVSLYDDSMSNLKVFKALKKEFPNVKFDAYYVTGHGEVTALESDSDNLDEYKKRRKKKLRWAAYGPGPYGWYGYDAGYSGDSGGGGESIQREQRSDPIEDFKPDNDTLDNLKSKHLPDWEMIDHRTLQAKYVAKDHRQAEVFVRMINSLSEKMDHFAEVTQDVAEVTVKTSTFDVKGLTILDFQLAIIVDKFAEDYDIQQVRMSGNFGMHDDVEEGVKDWVAGAALGTALAFGSPGDADAAKPKTTDIVKQVSKKDIAKSVTGNPHEVVLKKYAEKAGIKGQELAAFLSQAAHETMDFKHMKEIGGSLDFRKYDPKHAPKKAKALGNKFAGDGAKFKGRGYIQLTGRYNYKRAGEALGLPLEKHPELVEKPEVAAKVAVWYWQNRVANKVDNFKDTTAVTKPINPGLKHLDQRKEKHQAFQVAMK